jgi:type IX secretion system PorP/SprF family membrane protein
MAMKKIIWITLAGTLSVTAAEAQDAHLSQYEAAPVLLNPALTGMFEHSDFRMSCNLRSQWTRLSSNFLTTAFSYDAAINGKYGAGLYLSQYDQAGIFKTFEAGLSGAYNVSGKGARHTLSVGLKAGVIYKKVNDTDLLYDMQYNGDYFDSDLPTGEQVMRLTRLMPELGLGLAYRSIDQRRMVNPFASVALFHLTTPDETIFRVVQSDLHMRWSCMAGADVSITDLLKVTPQGLFMLQGQDREINVGLNGEMNLGGSAYSVLFGGACRFNDAAIAHIGVKHRNNTYRMSYDMNTSPLGEFSNKMGGFEFSIQYYGTHSGRERRVRRTQM